MSSGAPLTILFNFKTKPVIDSLPLPLSLVRADVGDDDSELLGLVAAMVNQVEEVRLLLKFEIRPPPDERWGRWTDVDEDSRDKTMMNG